MAGKGKQRKIPAGHHVWPFNGNVHPVGDRHKITGNLAKALDIPSGTEVHGDETNSMYYRYQPNKYKEGE